MSDPVSRLNAALEGRYAIERELGAGGMATVYLAEDLRHHRRVALKVLRPDLAATLGPERFLREIEIAAGLTHPHILPLHDSGEADGFLFYVLPYVDGESLRDRLLREGELPIAEAIRILRDVVDALAHAHHHGVVHRDIKPDNVMLSGRHALVTDFGVAKAVSEATGRHQLTTVGVALGTPAYMAPEQAEAADTIDHRADIYAVGALAYELLAGVPPFAGKSPQMTLLAHVTQAPEPVTTHRDTVSPALEQLVMRCLEKKAADRWQSAEEILGHLEALATPSGGLTPTSTTPIPRSGGLPRGVGATAAVIVLALGAWLGFGRAGTPPAVAPLASLTQLTANPLETALTGAAISPDGSYFAYVDLGGLHVQIVETGERRTLDVGSTGTPWNVRWFPDGTRLLFLAANDGGANDVWSVSLLGGVPRLVHRSVLSATVSPDGLSVAVVGGANASERSFDQVRVMDVNGENSRLLVRADPGESFWHVEWTPDSRSLAVGVWARSSRRAIDLVDVEGARRTELLADSLLLQYWTAILPFTWCTDGRLVFARRDGRLGENTSNLWIVGANVRTGQIVGEPRRLTQLAVTNVREVSVTADCSSIVALLVRNQSDVWLADLDESGTALIGQRQLTFDEREDQPLAWSPDGGSLLFSSARAGSTDLYTIEVADRASRPARLPDDNSVFDGAVGIRAAWAPEGGAILRLSSGGIYRIAPGSGAWERILQGAFTHLKCAHGGRCVAGRSEGEQYVFSELDVIGGTTTELTRLTRGATFNEWALSPDGGIVAMVHNDDNRIRLVELATGGVTTIAVAGWTNFEFVDWSADGSGLFVNAGFATIGSYPALLRVDLDGTAHVLGEAPNEWHVYPVASPDGRSLAFGRMPFHGNAWLITGF